jgi:type IV pilus assembly protein PilQ
MRLSRQTNETGRGRREQRGTCGENHEGHEARQGVSPFVGFMLFVVTVLGLSFATCFNVVAEETKPLSPAEGEGVVEEEVLSSPEEAGPTVAITPAGLISFDFREAAVRDVLRLFARQVEVNIVATPSVQGTISMKLDNVNWRKALELILDVHKFKMTEDKENNIIKVMTQTEVAAEPMNTKIYALKYLQAADYEAESVEYLEGKKVKVSKKMVGAATMLKPLVGKDETIDADAFGNKLIVNAIPATHDRLQAAIDELDKQSRQVLIEVKFIEASTDAAKDIGIKWDFLQEYGVEAFGPGSDASQERMGRSWTKTQTSSDGIASNLSEQRSLSENTKLRSKADDSGNALFDSIPGLTRDISHTANLSSARDLAWNSGTEVVKWATLSPDNVRLAVSALLKNSDAKLVSNPRISTVDNKQATIRAVKEFPIPKWTFNSDTGTWEVQGFDYKDIGITLKVTPHINQDNFITLDVDPEVSNQSGTVVFGGGSSGSAEIPIVDSRTAATRVIVKSGETLVIGGLVKTDEILTKSGVPLLQDIPLLGNAFKHTSKSAVNLDLFVFVTPTIVEGPAASILAPPPEYLPKSGEKEKAEVTASAEPTK